ncbi:glycogen debranching enzyme isoform X2 [Diorhabda carinulata]|uniref:glycogen debranching enzyme isoform X2 n=1 Tax=Diorhabda carinulata TaxID=1163345 RepID=UPI0025A14FB6|nr:glycogen debranching enzyme isoform X2 [Diorhabda carinulata]
MINNIASGVVISSFILFFLLRYRVKMTSLLTWIVGSLKSQTVVSTSKEEDLQKAENKSNGNKCISQSKRNKPHQKLKKTNDDPVFNTSLETPIEEIIEETINEEVKINKKKGKISKQSTKTGKLSKKNVIKPEPVDNTSVNISTVSKVTLENKIKKSTTVDSIKESRTEDVGFSFLPIKEKGKKYKVQSSTKYEARVDAITKKFEYTSGKSSEALVPKKDLTIEKPQSPVFSIIPTVAEKRLIYETSIKNKYKESKKVTSGVSYASIVTNSANKASLEYNLSSDDAINLQQESDLVKTEAHKEETFDLKSEKSDQITFDSLAISEENKSEIYASFEEDNSNLNNDNNSSLDYITVSDYLLETDIGNCSPYSFEETYVQHKKSFNSSDFSDLSQPISSVEHSFTDLVDSFSTSTNIYQSAEQFEASTENPVNLLERFDQVHEDLDHKREEYIIKSAVSEELFVENCLESEKFIREEINFGRRVWPFYNHEPTINSEEFELLLVDIKENIVREDQYIKEEQDFTHIVNTEGLKLEDFVYINTENEETLTNDKIILIKKVLHPNNSSFTEETNSFKQEQDFNNPLIDSCSEIEQEVNKKSKEDISGVGIFETMQQIRVLTLNDCEHRESTLYRLEKNWIIQFRIGPSLFGRKVFLYCNYPSKTNGSLNEFNRNKYQILEWVTKEGSENADDTALFTEIKVEIAGSFHYYFAYEKGETVEKQGSGYFLVDPVLMYGNDEDLPLDCIQCQTVLTKCLGSFSSWEKKLRVAKESGYNMIHFTPIQELGESNSSYSLSEQLKLNPIFKKDNGKMPTFQEIEQFIAKLRNEWKVTSICDIVLNHTANESKWIKEHPDVTYNCVNCPYMRPAYLLDAAFDFFSSEIKKGFYEDRGIPSEINNEDHLNAIRHHFKTSILDILKLNELFICDTNKLVDEFLILARSNQPNSLKCDSNCNNLKLIQDPEYRRLSSTVDMELALKLYNHFWNDTFDEDSRLKKCAEKFKNKLDELNNEKSKEINEHLDVAVENVIAGIRYYRVQQDGPKFKDITLKTPLVYRYFTDYGHPKSLQDFEKIMYSDKGRFLMAHNGWVMNSDPLKNFAASDSKVYLRRELIAWGDSVKLRFGDKPEDSPFLWSHMREYVEQTAKIFDGIRLDNCHSTPIPVAEYLLDCARRIRPNLYVVAELFTNSDMTDNIFVNRLGITSLIREAMSAWDSHEEGRLVYRYGGSPVGSFYQPNVRPLIPSIAHALFLDQTHDNPTPIEKRSVFDLLPSTALVNMACCASGSNRGYDELVPHHIHVVDEDREYTEWTPDTGSISVRYVTEESGIIKAKKAINDLHFLLGKKGFNQVYVDQMDTDIVAVTRHCPVTHQSYILVAFTAFGHPNEEAASYQRGIKPLRFEGVLEEIVVEATLSHINHRSGGSKFAKWGKFVKDSKWIHGLSEYRVSVKQHIQISESDIFEKVDSGNPNVTELKFKNFKPGSIVIVRTSLPETMSVAVNFIRNLIKSISLGDEKELTEIIGKLTLADMNRTLYRCDQEERDEGFGFGTYNIPNFSSTVYAGFQGFMSLLANIRPNNDLGHPMCANLRDGNWMIDYIWKRLKLDVGTKDLGEWLERNTKSFGNVPRYLVPCYFDMIVTNVYLALLDKSYKLMSNFVKNGSTFVKGLALGSIQFGGYIKSANLPTLSPNLAPPKPPTRKHGDETVQACVTLSAGLPHFSVGYMRNWGRDTFIALRGLFILTGRYQEAREHILGYAACLRHGLIPNLLDGGRNSRFNCRDAIWWWLYCIKEYVNEAPNGIEILSDKVSRIFPTDEAQNQPPGAVDQLLYDVMQESLKVHFQGLAFRERNAGRQIDEHMTDQGFNNQIGVHPETGFVFGGNKWNCGTWMDKMGSSDIAGNRGKPATPRDGSAVEIIGLSKCVLSWLGILCGENKYPYEGVQRVHKNGTITKWTFKEWANKIQNNFEKYFWIHLKPTEGELRPDLINKRGIYKDSFGSSAEYTDFQLRCNFPIAMVAAPELFTPSRAWEALKQAEKYLLGPLGMKTLDPEDWAYRGDYDNSNQSNDPTVAHGFNYHQGPEWVWPVGFFLRAKLYFACQNGALKETVASTKVILSKHFVELQTSDWRGLPELTNHNGAYCRDSSRTQAWSMSCILEVLHDLKKFESNLDLLSN